MAKSYIVSANSTTHLEALDTNMKKNIEGIHLLWRQMILINKKNPL